jgi:8-amino-7-oxononanoate synthase
MDGDGPDLGRVRELCDAYDAQLYLDEAHAIGVFGEAGAGLAGAAGIRPDVHMVAFGKAVGSQGACIAGSVPLRTFLWNRARSFVFSTAPAPFLCASLATQLDLTRRADGRRQALHAIAALFRARAHQAGIPVLPHSFGPICVAVVGTPEAALTAAETLRDQGILVQAIRPPTVRSGQCRLRATLHAGLGEDDVERAVAALAAALNDPLTDRTRA